MATTLNPLATQEFIAESTPVTITPYFDSPPISLIDGNIGPFVSSLPLSVPLWLAANLKGRHMCKVECPKWLTKGFLMTVLGHEKDPLNSAFYAKDDMREGYDTELPHHFLEISRILLRWEEDVADAHTVRTLIADIESVRASKVRESIRGLSAKVRNE